MKWAHCALACGWERTTSIRSSGISSRAIRQWRMGRSYSPTSVRPSASNASVSRVAVTAPSIEFSKGTQRAVGRALAHRHDRVVDRGRRDGLDRLIPDRAAESVLAEGPRRTEVRDPHYARARPVCCGSIRSRRRPSRWTCCWSVICSPATGFTTTWSVVSVPGVGLLVIGIFTVPDSPALRAWSWPVSWLPASVAVTLIPVSSLSPELVTWMSISWASAEHAVGRVRCEGGAPDRGGLELQPMDTPGGRRGLAGERVELADEGRLVQVVGCVGGHEPSIGQRRCGHALVVEDVLDLRLADLRPEDIAGVQRAHRVADRLDRIARLRSGRRLGDALRDRAEGIAAQGQGLDDRVLCVVHLAGHADVVGAVEEGLGGIPLAQDLLLGVE